MPNSKRENKLFNKVKAQCQVKTKKGIANDDDEVICILIDILVQRNCIFIFAN